ncbi:unnamed protein product [Lymnaea stagnalis]|uniref:Dermatopontin n=1 Tax=Lymnaea stagnalis TaxID=6523 RepID=A0AAV2IQ54_LYMST
MSTLKMLTVHVVLLLLYISARTNAVYVNEFDQQALFHCQTGEYIEEIESEHNNNHEDRRWSFQCGGDGATSACTWSSYVNSWREMVAYICPGDTVVTGIDSYHDNGSEDRRFKFRCCGIATKKPKNCYMTDYANDWDGKLLLIVPPGSVLKGAFSYFHDGHKDRRWKFYICDL